MAVKRCEVCGGTGFCKACEGRVMVGGRECKVCEGFGYCQECEGFGKVVDVEAADKAKGDK